MTIPSVMFLEMALDSLKTLAVEVPAWPPLVDGGPKTTTLDREVKEFRMLGDKRLSDFVLALAPLSRAGTVPNLAAVELGYLIGLETARVLLAGNIDAIRAGVSL